MNDFDNKFRKRYFVKPSDFCVENKKIFQYNKLRKKIPDNCQLNDELREKLMLAVCAINNCRYCSYLHIKSSLEQGVDEKEIKNLMKGELGEFPENEAKAIDPNFDPYSKKNVFENIQTRMGDSNLCVKLGEDGSLSLIDNDYIKNSALKIDDLKDTCGAGDAFLAALCIGDMDNPCESLQIANVWAGLSTRIHGTIPPKKEELLDYIKNI